MKFCKIDQIENVRQFAVNQYGLFYVTDDTFIPRLPEFDFKSMGFERTKIMLLDDFLCVQDNKGRTLLYDIPAESIVYKRTDLNKKGYGVSGSKIHKGRMLLCMTSSRPDYETFVFDVDNNEYEKIDKTWNQNIDYDKLLLRREVNPQSISRVALDGTEVWKYNIEGTYLSMPFSTEKPDSLTRVIGLHNNLLWLANISSELYAIDVESGDVKFSSKDVGYADHYMINSPRNNLISLERNYIRTIDISNDRFEREAASITDIFQEVSCEPDFNGQPLPIIDSHIIFCDQFKSVIGALNYESMEVDWIHDVFDTRGYAMISELMYRDGKLYALDNIGSGRSLHVFERT